MANPGRKPVYKTVTCEKCGAQIGATYYSRHLRNCKGIAKGRA